MKNFIYKINTYLIENHPIIWNTKLVWMLSATFIIHLIFYILGYSALTNPELLLDYRAKDIFLDNGTIFISAILSLLLLVIWLIHLFKNNAFKSFYPTSKLKLFKQFISYLVIVFASITFFLSYNAGLKNYISSTYNDDRVNKEISISNNVALFFSHDLESYTIDQRRYPEPFNTLYCENNNGYEVVSIPNKFDPTTTQNRILSNKEKFHPSYSQKNACLSFLDDYYCFYTLYSKEGTEQDRYNDSTYAGYIFTKRKDTVVTFFYKDSIFDITKITKSGHPSYYNYSRTFYDNSNNASHISYDYDYNNSNHNQFSKKHEIRNKKNYELLKRNNPKELKKLLEDFLIITNKYKVKHNLNAEKWFELIYHPNNFELKSLIRNEPKNDYEYTTNETTTALEEFNRNHLTDYYIESGDLHNAFSNIDDIKTSNTFIESIHFFMWFSMFIALIILVFRVTGLKPLLFAIITTGVLSLTVGLVSMVFAYITGFNDETLGYFVMYFVFILSTIILSIPIFYSKKIKKLIVAICLNISIVGFVLYVFLIIGIISFHQHNTCNNYYYNNDCFNLLESLGVNWSFILFIVNLIFIYFYFGVIKKWKALPEG